MKMRLKYQLGGLFLLLFTLTCAAQDLTKVELSDDGILLLDVVVDNNHIANSIDAYMVDNKLLVAIEPLFDSLKLRYQLSESQLNVWKEDELYNFNFTPPLTTWSAGENTPAIPQSVWAFDGFYQFIELSLIEKTFAASFNTDLARQIIHIETVRKNPDDLSLIRKAIDSVYLFPVQKLALLSERRQFNRFYNNSSNVALNKSAITIADQYRLFTPPHGRVNLAADIKNQQFVGSTQLVSDFLYHSANLSLSQTDSSDLAASLSLSRFKTAPNERILGLFDSYSLGDVSGVANNLTTTSDAGIGIVFRRAPDNYRLNNLQTTLEELAPPDWEAELFHNGIFLDKRQVPGDGRLKYENVELYYGRNKFEIRLYGPFGEEEIIYNNINVKQNPLAKGQSAYNFNALDNNHRLFNDESDADYGITNFGGSVNYGISDRWQMGFSFASIDSEQQLYSIKNAVSFDNLLIENDLAYDQDGNYAQLSSVTGSLFLNDNYSLQFESGKNFTSETVSAQNNQYSRFAGNYSLPSNFVITRFGAEYRQDNQIKNFSLSNQLSRRFGPLSVSHTLTYNQSEITPLEGISIKNEQLTGNVGLNGRLAGGSLSALINYDPELSEPILKNSSISFRTTIKDPFETKHNIQAQYFPFNDKGQRWRLNHSVLWQTKNYSMTMTTAYDSNDDWNVQLGAQFFLGYDYHHKRVIMNNTFSGGSATLDAHAYLDRQANGVPDVLDYDLADVKYTGNPEWTTFSSGPDGRSILPGVYGNSEFAFGATWQEGSATVNNNYVVYTHPGAYVDVNMPFYLITDLTGFVLRQQGGEEIGLRNIEIHLLDDENNLINSVETDQDGYYEFLQLRPNAYKVQIARESLDAKGLTSDIIGINVTARGRGGFVELPSIILSRVNDEGMRGAERNNIFIINEENTDELVWDRDEEVDNNYFSLPRNGKTQTIYSLTQPASQNKIQQNSTEEVELSSEIESLTMRDDFATRLPQTDKVFDKPAVLLKVKGARSILPRLKISTNSLVSATITPTELEGKPSDIVNTKDWTIQFEANIAQVVKSEALKQYVIIGDIYIGEKTSVNVGVLHCVISQAFSSKTAAQQALERTGLSGWVSELKNYTRVEKIN
jgi:hypothetical protein